MMMLRAMAVAIAVAGLADPAITISRAVRPPLTVTILDTPSLALPDGRQQFRREAAFRSAEVLTTELRNEFTVTLREQSVYSTADPCQPAGACVVISDGARPRTMHAGDRFLGAVHVASALTPNIAIRSVDAATTAELGALATIEIGLEARGVSNTSSTVDLFDGDVPVGSASHDWPTTSGQTLSRASVRVEWAPIEPGARDLRAVVRAVPGEMTVIDNEARAIVDVGHRAMNVLVYEPQPTWTATFLRLALEQDRRFNVTTRARLGPAHVVSSRPFQLTADALEKGDTRAVVVSAPNLLGRGEIAELTRWVRQRGGSVVLLLDAPPLGEIAQLLDASGVARAESAPVAVGPLKAAELVVLRPRARSSTALASAEDASVIITTPSGRGRWIASGAVDAWRYRADGAFDSFWRALLADAAQATGESLALRVSPSVASVGERVDVHVERRSTHGVDGALDVSAILRCAGREMPIRLWPAGGVGRFRGAFDMPWPGQCRVSVGLEGFGTTEQNVQGFALSGGAFTDRDDISHAVAAYGGTVVDAGDEGTLVTKLRSLASRASAPVPMHPLRSAWWIVPFGACLGTEWWLRRRRGLR